MISRITPITYLVRCLVLAGAIGLAACSTPPREFAAPNAERYAEAEVLGFEHVRFWGDDVAPYIEDVVERLQRALFERPELRRRMDVLALSGGAEDGAYGAGVLGGWSTRGDRPEFLMVTGISTGALIAPFAFLGSEYDAAIRRFFTETSKEDIVELAPFSLLAGGTAVGDSAPLRRFIRREVNDEMVAAIARESRRGRFLHIGTTNLDAQRSVIWDIGRIAESGHPDATELIGDIMLASASIPGAFPPVIFDVTIDGVRHQEVHVDGGVTNQIFVYPRTLRVREIERRLTAWPEKAFWLIRNTKVEPEYKAVPLTVTEITQRAINTLIKYQGRGDLLAISTLAKRDGFDIHLASVPAEFQVPLDDLFDTNYMRALYQVGYESGVSGSAWDVRDDDFLIE